MAKKQTKKIQFDHLRPYFLDDTGENGGVEAVYNLGPLLKFISDGRINDTRRTIFGDLYLFHVCKYDEKLKLWELQILHLREKILPGIADTDGSYELIQLDDKQYPAESTTILYDEEHCTLFMQRNVYGLSIRNFEIYLQLLSPENTLVLLKAIKTGNRLGKIQATNLYRRVLLVADTDELNEEHGEMSLAKTLKSFGKYQGRMVKIELGFGHQRTGRLNSGAVSSLVREAYNFNGTRNLEVRVSDPDDVSFETINLLDDRATYLIDIKFSRDNPITHKRLFKACLAEYKQEAGIEG